MRTKLAGLGYEVSEAVRDIVTEPYRLIAVGIAAVVVAALRLWLS